MPKKRYVLTSGFVGICFQKRRGKWKAEIRTNNVKKYLGDFASKEEAARAYDDASRFYHGEFARVNFPSHLP